MLVMFISVTGTMLFIVAPVIIYLRLTKGNHYNTVIFFNIGYAMYLGCLVMINAFDIIYNLVNNALGI